MIEEYSDDFTSDDDDARRASQNRQRPAKHYNANQKSHNNTSPLKMNGRRKVSVDFWTTPRSHDSPVNSLEGEVETTNQGLSQHRLLPTHTSRLTLSRGLTHTKSPASHAVGEHEDNTTFHGHGSTQPVPRRVQMRSEVKPREGRGAKKSHGTSGNESGVRSNPLFQKQLTYGRSKQTSKSRGRGRGRGRSSKQQTSPRVDNVMQRMLSAHRLKINELRNHTDDQITVINDLKDENRLYKKMQFRQEKALYKFEDQESDLPRIMLKHTNEVRALHEHLKAAKEKYSKADRYLRDAEDDLDRANTKLKKYKSLAESKNLPERDELNRKLQQAEIDMEEKDSKINELQRHIDHLSKNHRHELGVEIARHRETKRVLVNIKEDKDSLDHKLKEKEKELDIKNIYSNRVMRAPHKLPASYSGTPLESPSPRGRRNPSITEMSARDKARLFESKRREDMKKIITMHGKESRRKYKPKSKEMFGDSNISLDEKTNHLVQEARERDEERERDRELDMESERNRDRERDRNQEYERERRERERERELEEEEHRRAREKLKRESEEFTKRRREEKEREEYDEIERRQRDGLLDRERREREDEFQRERERELADRQRRELEAREEKEREMKRQADEERERMENDPRMIEEQKKKDLLLARLKMIDAGKKDDISPQNVSPFEDDVSTTSSKKNYTFSKPIVNLHNGKPSQGNMSKPSMDRRQRRSNDDVGGYDPSFGKFSSSTETGGDKVSPSQKASKKADLMDELFGGQSDKAKKDDDSFFLPSDTKKKSSTRSSAFPWDDSKSDKHSASLSRPRENSSTLFGGGAALIEDDVISDKSKLLPRRNRHQSSIFTTKPAVSAVDNFEDDLEEVIL